MLTRRALTAAGCVATVAGCYQVLAGVDGVRTGARAHANLDSEIRFYGAWYATAGVLMLRNATGAATDRGTTRVLAGGWLLAATGRLLSLRSSGRPDRLFLALTAAELAVAAALAAAPADGAAV